MNGERWTVKCIYCDFSYPCPESGTPEELMFEAMAHSPKCEGRPKRVSPTEADLLARIPQFIKS